MGTTIIKDESYKHQEENFDWPASEFPFFYGDGQQELVFCNGASNFTALIDTRGDKRMGIIAIAGEDGGLFAPFTADQLRQCAEQLNRMADYMDSENA